MKITLILILIFYSVKSDYLYSQWIVQPLPAGSGHSLAIDFLDINHGITCGAFIDFDIHAKAFYTSNSGVSWQTASFPDSGKLFNSLKFVDPVLSYMGGSYRPEIYNTSNANLTDDKFINNNLYNKLSSISQDLRAFFLKSTNYGKEWYDHTSQDLYTYYSLDAIDFINGEKGIAIAKRFDSVKGFSDDILLTTNSGLNWNLSFSKIDSLTVDLVSIQYVNDNIIYSAGNSNKGNVYKSIILKSADSGFSWEISTINDFIINKISFSDINTGYSIGTSSVNTYCLLFRTTNGGINWNLIQTFDEDQFNGVTFLKNYGIGLLYGFRVLKAPIILFTTNYGITWFRQPIPATSDIFFTDAEILNPYVMYVTGGEYFSNGNVLHTSSGGWTFLNNSNGNNSTGNFNLFQNYPNPFNPQTRINFYLTLESYIEIKIMNTAGIELYTLINGNKDPGYHEIVFDGTGLSGGIYFYSLLVNGKLMDSKKMVLLK